MFEFGALPPEVNSGWIYTGPGAAPMTAAAAAWHALAAELGSTAAAYQAVVARMSGELWTGAASASMAAAAAPYVAWLNTTAAQAEQAATQAAAAAAAFETAFAMTVPPPVIAANRSLLLTLVATNLLGQNTPAIAATEAHYAQMWAQDAAAMYGYAGASAAAAQVTPFTEPGQTTDPAGLAGQAAAVGQAAGNSQTTQLLSTLPTVLQGLASPLQAGGIADNVNGLVNTGAWNVASTLSTALGFLSNLGSSAGSALGSGSGGLTSAAVTPMAALGSAGLGGFGGLGAFGGAPVSASLGQAGAAGLLSVPPAWATTATAGSPALPGATPASAAERGVGAMPAGMPIGALGARAASAATAPNYGFRPTVVMHPVAAG